MCLCIQKPIVNTDAQIAIVLPKKGLLGMHEDWTTLMIFECNPVPLAIGAVVLAVVSLKLVCHLF